MELTDYVCYKKNDKIYSLGVEINSSLANNDNCLNFIKDKKQSNTNIDPKKLFRCNLGVPLPLYLIQNEANKIKDFFENTDTNNKTTANNHKCIGRTLFDNLFELQKYSRKIPKTRKKRRSKKKRKTRKLSIF